MGIVMLHLVNYTLSFLMWMIVGRAFLALLVGTRENIVMLAFVKITEPVYRVTRRILPFAQGRWTPVFSFLLLAALRVAMMIFLRPAGGR